MSRSNDRPLPTPGHMCLLLDAERARAEAGRPTARRWALVFGIFGAAQYCCCCCCCCCCRATYLLVWFIVSSRCCLLLVACCCCCVSLAAAAYLLLLLCIWPCLKLWSSMRDGFVTILMDFRLSRLPKHRARKGCCLRSLLPRGSATAVCVGHHSL